MPKLAHVCIESADLEATARFYACLGLRQRFEFRNPAGLLIGYYLQFDNLTFLEVVRVRHVRSEGGFRHFAIETDNLDDLRNKLLQAGYAPEPKCLGEDNTWLVKCHDPSGVMIELQQYGCKSMQLEGGVCVVDYTP
ncbi:MAG: VOC family protein [Proteobacteria bacterium]|nr:VOC family protein [Pseudomonadota bacterium]